MSLASIDAVESLTAFARASSFVEASARGELFEFLFDACKRSNSACAFPSVAALRRDDVTGATGFGSYSTATACGLFDESFVTSWAAVVSGGFDGGWSVGASGWVGVGTR